MQNPEATKLPLFTMMRNACHQNICLKSTSCRQGWKGSLELSCPSQQASAWRAQERWLCRVKEQVLVMSQATTTCCILFLAPLFPKPYVPNWFCLVRFCCGVLVHGHFEYSQTSETLLCWVRLFLQTSHTSFPLFLFPHRNSWTKTHTSGTGQKLTVQAFSTASHSE